MLPPQRHLKLKCLLVINGLSHHFNRFSVRASLLAVIFMATSLIINAQLHPIHDPNVKISVTDDQVRALGEASPNEISLPIVLDFEGMRNLDEILQFYHGGTSKSGFSGTNRGISFSPGANAIIDKQHGGSGNFSSEPQPNTVMFSLSGNEISINIDSGFTEAFSFLYTSSSPGTVSIFDGPDGTGNLLASKPFQPLTSGPDSVALTIPFKNWQWIKLTFANTARSVVIMGAANQYAFDDLTFGNDTHGKSKGLAGSGGGKSSGFSSYFTKSSSMTERGKLFIEGASRFGISIGNEKSKSGGSVVDGSESTYYDLYFLPKVGYFIIDNLVGGIYIDLELYNNKPKAETGYGYKGVTFIFGPFARYYVPVSDKIIPFAEAQVGFGIDSYSSRSSSSSDWYKTKESVFTYRLGAGATYFVNEVVGLDAFAGFLHDSYKYKESEDESRSSDSKSIYNEFILQLGIVVILGM
jgi:hypothetical protein